MKNNKIVRNKQTTNLRRMNYINYILSYLLTWFLNYQSFETHAWMDLKITTTRRLHGTIETINMQVSLCFSIIEAMLFNWFRCILV